MSIRINEAKCIGCKKCEKVCPGSLISTDTGKAQINFPKDCWGCVSCVKECSQGAIEFYLAEDMGGNESVYMQVEKENRFLNWKFYSNEELIRTIKVDSTSSNKY